MNPLIRWISVATVGNWVDSDVDYVIAVADKQKPAAVPP
jgi:hypothetical protein